MKKLTCNFFLFYLIYFSTPSSCKLSYVISSSDRTEQSSIWAIIIQVKTRSDDGVAGRDDLFITSWLIELSDNELSDNSLASELVENGGFLNQS